MQIQIEFMSQEQLRLFVKWFKKEGYDNLLKSDINDGDEPITCLAADEKMEWGHYFELQ